MSGPRIIGIEKFPELHAAYQRELGALMTAARMSGCGNCGGKLDCLIAKYRGLMAARKVR